MRRQPGQLLNSGRRRAAVLGSPISHSLSPVLHRAAYAALELDWTYDAVEMEAAGLAGFIAGLDDTWAGLSLTMPLKEAVLPVLDVISSTARVTRAANTVVLGESGREGHNTDVYGMVEAVRAVEADAVSSACIIGAGATARSAAAACGALGAKSLVVVARRPAAADQVLATAGAVGIEARAVGWGEAADVLGAGLVVSTVPGDAATTLTRAVPNGPGLLLDVTYEPWPTTLAVAWSRAGGRIVPGSQMLLWQAARQVTLMTSMPAPVEVMARALAAAVAARGGA